MKPAKYPYGSLGIVGFKKFLFNRENREYINHSYRALLFGKL